ncbi:MAG: hypothetical protein Q4F95_15985 [Oscillospiraceae bacterium]|nr:hypothetical protein [Oscillospiraceae bacterium]
MHKPGEFIFVFLIGCFMYSLLEIAARGFTHWSMTLTGGVCLTYIYILTINTQSSTFKTCLKGAIFITLIEFAVGFTVNIILKWNVWDYSDMPLNVMGQVCLPFTVLWFSLCFLGNRICRLISRKFEQIYRSQMISNCVTQPIYLNQEN